jgi:hypothetical protein
MHDTEDLRRRFGRFLRCCAWVVARVDTTAAGLTPDGLCPFLALPGYPVDEIRRRSDELGPMIAAICEDAARIGMSADELAG